MEKVTITVSNNEYYIYFDGKLLGKIRDIYYDNSIATIATEIGITSLDLVKALIHAEYQQ